MNHTISLHKVNLWPKELKVIIEGQSFEEVKTIKSQEEMNRLLEEVKLYNLENENKKRIISL